jgi:Tol biopolymer transport system component
VIQLTQPGYVDIDPAYTADEGRSIMFASNRYTQPNVLQIRADQPGGIQTVFRDPRGWAASRPSMGADGSIVFTLLPPAGARDVDPEIWTTGGPNQFDTFVRNGEEAQVSPDGSKIAYISKDGNLWVINRDGTNPTQLTTQAEEIKSKLLGSLSSRDRAFYQRYPHLLRPYALPTWTPDSQRIMFVSMEGVDSTGRPNADIWLVLTDGTGARQLTANGSVDTYPVMSPDLQKIYFVSNRGNRWAIFVMPIPAQ